MISSNQDSSAAGEPTPVMLAGVNVRIEADEDLTVHNVQPPQPLAMSSVNGTVQPTTDQLAGVYVLVEAVEDLTVHPRAAATGSPVS